MWQITRFNVYAALGIFSLSPVFRSLGDTNMTVGLYRDDRTRPLLEKLKGQMQNGGLQRIAGNLPNASGQESGSTVGQDDASSEYSFSDQGDGYDGGAGVGYSDAMNDTGDVAASARPSPSHFPSQTPQQHQGLARRNQRPSNQDYSPASSAPPNQMSQQDADPFSFNEDPLSNSSSDPDSPQYNPAAVQQQKPRRSWAEIRTEARQGTGTQPQSTPSYAGGQGERFSYGREEEEKQYAKGQAQKDFDAMLDRERQLGEQGNEGSGGGAWSRRRGGG